MALEALVSEGVKGKSGKRLTFGEAMGFRPSGLDVDLTKCLLMAQTFELVLNIVVNAQSTGFAVTIL